jgi:hypothetical protein
MGQVFRSRRGYSVTVNSNDHPPPHVHAYGRALGSRFKFDCDAQTIEAWDAKGKWSQAHLNELGEEIAEHLTECCDEWRRVYG